MSRLLNTVERGHKKNRSIIFLHGFMGNLTNFNKIISGLEEKYHCVAIDLPGHGESLFRKIGPLKELKSFHDVSKLIINNLDDLGINSFSLYGYSMGGRVAQSISISVPHRIKNLILESSSFGLEDLEVRKKRLEKDLQLFSGIRTKSDFRKLLDRWHNMPMFTTLQGTEHITDLINFKLKNNTGELIEAMKILSVGKQDYHPYLLKNKKIDIDYIYGKLDSKFSGLAVETKRIIPDMKMHKFDMASHNVHVEFPEKIVSLIKKILDR